MGQSVPSSSPPVKIGVPLQVTGPDDGPLAHYFIFDRPPTEEEWERTRRGKGLKAGLIAVSRDALA